MKKKPTIPEIFSALSEDEYLKSLIKKRIIKIILGSSVIRALPAGTKPILTLRLETIPVLELCAIDSQISFNAWHKRQVSKVEKCLKGCINDSTRLKEDEVFGHAAKIFNLYLSHLVLYSAFFSQDEVMRIKYFLHVPLDSKVFSAIKVDKSLDIPNSIKSLKPKSYNSIQDTIRKCAAQFKLPAIYFDEFAWTLEDD